MKNLFVTRRFLPLFMTQFLGIFNDNLFKNAFIILMTYRIALHDPLYAAHLVNFAFALYILPSLLFSSLAGCVADKFDRDAIGRLVKVAEIALVFLGCIGLFFENLYLLYATLFGFGVHSNFFSSLKCAMLPQHLKEDELAAGNAYMEAGTFLAILAGTITGGILILMAHGVVYLIFAMTSVALAGYIFSLYIPTAKAPDPHLPISLNPFSELKGMLDRTVKQKDVFAAILGISWFWFIATMFLAQISPFAKNILFANENVVTLFLTVFSLGMVVGSLLCGKFLKEKIHTGFVPYAAFCLSACAVDLYFASHAVTAVTEVGLHSVAQFMQQPSSLRILFDFWMIALCGGFYTVSLYTMMQYKSEKASIARTMAVNNLINALFMIIATGFSVVMLQAGLSIPQIFLVVGGGNIIFAALWMMFFRRSRYT
ncbi:MAG: MFS transporter [Alphaproteobacteria bacterium]|nr:MFS transporter [Alphaproteobacteria bacterium]MBP7761928.1 MFS transporter [Alphaproteobacteria bacterium]